MSQTSQDYKWVTQNTKLKELNEHLTNFSPFEIKELKKRFTSFNLKT